MRNWHSRLLCGLLFAIFASLASLPSAAGECDLSEVKGIAQLNETLSRRAVEVVERAARSGYRTDVRLAQLVESSATFDLGAGDVGRPLGSGVEGARSLAHAMRAESFQFTGWDFMDMPVDGCGTHEVTVDFIDGPGKGLSMMKFTFRAGRIVSGIGWAHSLESGPLDRVEEHP